MIYIIMCGGKYRAWETPRHLVRIRGEPLVARTIRLLREAGVEDIAISSDNPVFEQFGVPVLKHDNDYDATSYNNFTGYWSSAFCPTGEPTCYIFGDVVFSPEAIKTIVDYETDDVMFFGSKVPYAPEYPKRHQEPFAFKVANMERFFDAIEEHKRMTDSGKRWRKPIAWELWFILCGHPDEDLRSEVNNSYVGIYDYTCDIDYPDDIRLFDEVII